jgi:hypothetical protein
MVRGGRVKSISRPIGNPSEGSAETAQQQLSGGVVQLLEVEERDRRCGIGVAVGGNRKCV